MAASSYFDIPVIRPTAEELQDFSSLIEKHIDAFREAGLMKIVPPENWATNLPMEKDAEAFTVNRPIRQELKGRQGLWETANVEQKSYSVSEFRRMAETQGKEAAPRTIAERERIFWKNMGRFPATYGADNPGSLFEKTGCSWNFGKIRSILSYLDRDLPGINKAYLYYGMWKALFAWHSEDLELFSVNYVHFGAPKEWYCLRPKDKGRFESFASSLFAGQAHACSQFLRHKMTVISPQTLEKHGFEIGHVVQEAGQFIVTFPAAYHMGFNHGWNCAESVNFALPAWLEYGKRARVCRCQPDSVRFDVLGLERRWLEATGQQPKAETGTGEQWSFICRCQPEWHGTDNQPDQPIGHLFQCTGCSWWSHVDCYPRYADRDPIDLPQQMYCLKCRPLPAPKRTSNDNAPKEEKLAVTKRTKSTSKKEPAPATAVAPTCTPKPPSPIFKYYAPLPIDPTSHAAAVTALPPSLPLPLILAQAPFAPPPSVAAMHEGMHVPFMPRPDEMVDHSTSANSVAHTQLSSPYFPSLVPSPYVANPIEVLPPHGYLQTLPSFAPSVPPMQYHNPYFLPQ